MSVEEHKIWACKEVQDIIAKLDDQFLDNFLMATSGGEVEEIYQELDRADVLTPQMAACVLLLYVEAKDLKRIYDTQSTETQKKIDLLQAMLSLDLSVRDSVAGMTFSFNSEDKDLMNISLASMTVVVLPRLEANMRAMQVAELFDERAKDMFKVYMQCCDILIDKKEAAQAASPKLITAFLEQGAKIEKYLQPRYQDALMAKMDTTQGSLDKVIQDAKQKQEQLEKQNLERLRAISTRHKRKRFLGL